MAAYGLLAIDTSLRIACKQSFARLDVAMTYITIINWCRRSTLRCFNILFFAFNRTST